MRYKRLEISLECLAAIFKKTKSYCRVVQNPLPDDAHIVSITPQHDFVNDNVFLLIESKEFANVDEGATIPLLELPVFEATFIPEKQ